MSSSEDLGRQTPVAQRPAAGVDDAGRYSGVRGVPRIVWPLLALALLLLYNAVFTRGFFSISLKEGHLYGSLIDILDNAAPVMLVALGMTLVIATGGVDLSVGAVMAVSGAVAALLVTRTGLPFAAVVAVALSAGLMAGAWNGLLVSLFNIQPIVATLILMVAGRGVAMLLTDSQKIPFRHAAFSYIGSGHFLTVPFAITLVALILAATAALTRLTAAGLFIEATGNNLRAARNAGVNTRAVIFAAYTFTGLVSALAGLIPAADINTADPAKAGLYLELDAILAVVIGGTSLTGGRFSLLGAVIGALIIQTLTTTILTRAIDPAYDQVLKALVVLAVCLLQSETFRARLVRRKVA
jgi:simple sugar transport system permease protein